MKVVKVEELLSEETKWHLGAALWEVFISLSNSQSYKQQSEVKMSAKPWFMALASPQKE